MIDRRHNNQILSKKTGNQKFLTGFTVLELLIVIAIVGFIASVLLVSFKGAMERARIAQGWQFSDSLRGALQMDMVAWWPLDRIDNGKTPDSWFDRLDGTIYGNVQEAEGIVNNALSFDGSIIFGGSNSYVNMWNVLNMGTSDFTIEGWAKTTSDMPGFLVSKRIEWRIGYQVGISNGYLMGYIKDSSGGTSSPANGPRVNDGKWHHLVVIFDRDGNMTRYVDGYQAGTTIDISSRNLSLDNTVDFRIGAFGDDTGFFNGFIDEVRIYNVALPLATIQQHYVQGLKRHQNLAIR